MKFWITKAVEYLEQSLGKVPQEINELDWKESLSPKNEKLSQHICAFANLPGGDLSFLELRIKRRCPRG